MAMCTPHLVTHAPPAHTHPPGDPPRHTLHGHPLWSTSGWYASCWYAFLYGKVFAENCMKMKETGPRRRGACVPSAPLGTANELLMPTSLLQLKI